MDVFIIDFVMPAAIFIIFFMTLYARRRLLSFLSNRASEIVVDMTDMDDELDICMNSVPPVLKDARIHTAQAPYREPGVPKEVQKTFRQMAIDTVREAEIRAGATNKSLLFVLLAIVDELREIALTLKEKK
jgi:hypothetical protein